MTAFTIMAGLLPIMWATGTGSEVMRRLTEPMDRRHVVVDRLTFLVIPAIYWLYLKRRLRSGR